MNSEPRPVSVVRCDSYEHDRALAAVSEAVDRLGGIAQFVRPGQKVLLKVNLLTRKRPEEAVTTHPAVVEAVARLVQQAGGKVTIADSPAGQYTEPALRALYQITGLTDVAERTGAELNYDVTELTRPHPEGRVAKSFAIIKPLVDADVIIPVSKLKTHGLTTYTGAVKVLFGVIPGLHKAEYHLRMPVLDDFADMLVDIAEMVKPQLSIMDAVVGMDKAGPSAGRPRDIGLILASASPFALDVAAVAAVGGNPAAVPTIAAAGRRGLPSTLADIEWLGPRLEDVLASGFEFPARGGFARLAARATSPFGRRLVGLAQPRPVFRHVSCSGCGECARNCPAKVITMRDGRPYVSLDRCIRCFCCQEVCPQKDVEIRRPWLNRTLFRQGGSR